MLILVLLIWIINYIVSWFLVTSRQTYSFECGFEHQSWISQSPTLHFVKIAIIFVIFDLEILFLLTFFFQLNWILVFIIIILLVRTLWLEFYLNRLAWIL